MNLRENRGFTLIEIIVVVTIIGFLSTIIISFLGDARAKSRDNRRVSDIKQINTALELYFSNHGTYPEEIGGCTGGWETSTCGLGGGFLNVLKSEGYISSVPVDPANNSEYYYAYYKFNPGNNGCTFRHAVLGIKNFELDNQKIEVNAKCPNMDWGNTFDYSILLSE